MSKDQEREAFEAWVRADTTLHLDRDMRGYADMTTELLWHAWQARAAMAPAGEPIGWYCVSREGMATLCADEEDAKQVAAESFVAYPQNGPYRAVQLYAHPSPATDRAEVLRLADEMALRSYEEAQCACYTEEEAKSRNSQSSARAALVRLLGGE
mgnify:CR=1 FL=1